MKTVICNLNIEVNSSGTLRKTFYAMFFIFGYALPFYIMIILYGIVFTKLKCGARNTETLECNTRGNRAQGRATKMVIAVIMCFLLCRLQNTSVINLRFSSFRSFTPVPVNSNFISETL